MKKILVIVDMQNDFVSGALGSAEAQRIAPRVAEKIAAHEGEIVVTYDTHTESYLETREGRWLPVPHCIKGTDGWSLSTEIASALEGKKYTAVEKPTFGSVELPGIVEELSGGDDFEVELCGVCTDICVVSNALLLKARFPEIDISVDASACAGVTPAAHKAALDTMRSCQIEVLGE